MKITAVRTTLFQDGAAPSYSARGVIPSRTGTARCLVELVTDAALSGLAVAPAVASRAIEALAKGLLIGEDPRAATSLWERTGHAVSAAGDRAAAQARAALDIAAWDLKARASDEPLWKTLGGSRPSANAHLHHEYRPADAETMFDWYRTLSAETGIRSGSLPVSGDPEKDLQDLEKLQQVLGATVPESALMVHFNGPGWPADAIRHIRKLESAFDLTWVRSPVRPDDFRGARLVADSVTAAVCMGRGLPGVSAYLPFLESYAANVLELDVALLGISGIVQMADAAFGFELPVALSPHAGHLSVQLFSVLPTSMSVAIDGGSSVSGVVCSTVTFENGRAVPADEPGNGLVIDRDALQAARLPVGAAT